MVVRAKSHRQKMKKLKLTNKPITRILDARHQEILVSPDLQKRWADLGDELYDWLKQRFDQPLEAFAFLRLALESFEKQHHVKGVEKRIDHE